jgi:hypothetical protein
MGVSCGVPLLGSRCTCMAVVCFCCMAGLALEVWGEPRVCVVWSVWRGQPEGGKGGKGCMVWGL